MKLAQEPSSSAPRVRHRTRSHVACATTQMTAGPPIILGGIRPGTLVAAVRKPHCIPWEATRTRRAAPRGVDPVVKRGALQPGRSAFLALRRFVPARTVVLLRHNCNSPSGLW
jgi:hypothetical protein